MPVTIHDVAEKAGVGIGTVSSVLNNSRPVHEATRQRVLAAVAELDFIPNPSGRRLSIGKTHTIAVVITFFTSAAQIERLRGVMSLIVESDYDINLFVVDTIDQRNKVFQTVPRRGRVDGLLIFSLKPSEEDLHRIHQHNIPIVLVEVSHPGFSHITIDDTVGARMAVQHLIDLGHRRIAYVSDYLDDPFEIYFSRNRYLGYCEALDDANIPIESAYLREARNGRVGGRKMALELLNLPDPPTAIFAFSDEMALGVLEAARDLGLNVPADLSVVGYDDIELAHFAQLTTVRQHLHESGVRGVEMLFNAIQNPDAPPTCFQFPTELIVRHTTASLSS